MASLNMVLTCDQSADTMVQQYQRSTSAKFADVQALSQLLQKLNSGGLKGSPPQVVVSVLENTAKASGYFALTSVIATDAISINGVTFTCVASGAGANEFNVGVNDTATAVNLAAAINASVTALVAGYVTAASSVVAMVPRVTVTSAFYGKSGNQTLIASADGTIVASGARLSGGAVDADSKTYSF